MNRLARGTIALGIGVGTFLGAREVLDHAIIPKSEIVNGVQKCASRLGSQAMKASVLPQACKGYESSFDYTETVNQVYDHKSQDVKTTHSTRTYTLVPAAEFVKENTPTSDPRSDYFLFGGELLAGMLGAVSAYAYMVGEARRTRQDQDWDDYMAKQIASQTEA